MLVAFDVNGTLLSLERVRAALREQSLPEWLLPFWFARLLHVVMTRTLVGHYVPFAAAAESSLQQVLALQGFPESAAAPVLAALEQLDPWDDARECVESLARAGHRVAALTNGSAEIAEPLLERAGLRRSLCAVLSADAAGAAKPHPAPYRMLLDRLEADPAETWFVAAHGWDVVGADAVGLRTVWISRVEKRWSLPGAPPGHSVPDLRQVPAALARANAAAPS